MGASAVRARAMDCAVFKAYYLVASAPGRQRAQPAQQREAVKQTGFFFRTLRFEEYVGGSPGRVAPEESQNPQC